MPPFAFFPSFSFSLLSQHHANYHKRLWNVPPVFLVSLSRPELAYINCNIETRNDRLARAGESSRCFLKKTIALFIFCLIKKKKMHFFRSIHSKNCNIFEFGERTREREKKIVKMFEKFLIRIGDKYFENREIFGCNWNRYFIYLFFSSSRKYEWKMMGEKKKIHLSRVCDFFRNDESRIGSKQSANHISSDI